MEDSSSQPKFFYRVYERSYAPSPDASGDCYGPGSLRVHVQKFEVKKATLKGFWIGYSFVTPHFILTSAKKKYACPTLKEAFESFYARKKRQSFNTTGTA